MKVIFVLCLLIAAVVATSSEEDDPCDTGCPRIQAPVCGYDTEPKEGETFANECVLGYFACKRGRLFKNMIQGSCPDVVYVIAARRSSCDGPCYELLDPVCGYHTDPTDGETFANDCQIESFACERGWSYPNVIRGICPKRN